MTILWPYMAPFSGYYQPLLRLPSVKVIETGTNQQSLCDDFLLVFYCNVAISRVVSEIKRAIGRKSRLCHAMLCINAAYAVVRRLMSVTFVYRVEMAKDTATDPIECEYKSVPKLSNCTIFNDLERSLTKISRSRHYATPNISET